MPDRREFLGLLSSIPLLSAARLRPLPADDDDHAYDLVLKGGHVIDPASGLSGVRDVAIRQARIAAIAPDIPASRARVLFDAAGRIVTPGLIDVHVHVFEGIAGVAMSADAGSLAHGATTVVDAGSAGATTFAGFRRCIVQPSATRIYAALNISTIGLASLDELSNPAFVDTKAAIETIEQNRDLIVAIKVRSTPALTGRRDLDVLQRARDVSDATGVPLMVHIGGSPSPLRDLLATLRRGDMVTHVLRERPHGVIDAGGRVRDEFQDARARGVVMDVGHGSGNFSWETAEAAAAQDWWPDTISSDLHSRNANGPVFDSGHHPVQVPAARPSTGAGRRPGDGGAGRRLSVSGRMRHVAPGCAGRRGGLPPRWHAVHLHRFATPDAGRQTRPHPRRNVQTGCAGSARRVEGTRAD